VLTAFTRLGHIVDYFSRSDWHTSFALLPPTRSFDDFLYILRVFSAHLRLIISTVRLAPNFSGMTSMQHQNKLSSIVQRINSAPAFCRSWLLSALFGRTIKFAGTAAVQVEQLDFQKARLKLANRRKVQNHIGSVHAAATALLGESASGFLLGMHVPDDKIPLLKSMQIQYLKRSTGALTAQAQLNDEQISHIATADKGEVVIRVLIKDQLGVEPVEALYTWAWIPKIRK